MHWSFEFIVDLIFDSSDHGYWWVEIITGQTVANNLISDLISGQ